MRRRLIIIAAALLAGVTLVSCQTGRTMFAPCANAGDGNPFGTDGKYVLLCEHGKWKPIMTVGEYIKIAEHKPVSIAPLPTEPPPPSPPPPTTVPAPGAPVLTRTDVVTGLVNPWDLAFTPDGTMLFTERVGRIDAWVGGVKRVLAQPADVVVQLEGGMLGVAVDPAFASNRRIYTCFLSNVSGALDVRVARWQVNASYTALTNRTDIVTGLPVNTALEAGRHAGCRPRFGPDGFLWVTAGDSAVGTVPQSRTVLGGKVLRVTTTGAGASGNPGGTLDARIYTLGHRNPQGLAFRSNGQVFSVEHGTDRDDEVNRLVAGGNYGWDPRPLAGGPGYDETRPMTDPARVAGAIGAVWSSGFPTVAPSGATFLNGAQWKGWNGALAIAVLKAQKLFVLQLDAGGTAVTQSWNAVTDQGRLRTAVQGPDGALYMATDANPGKIFKLTPS